MGMKCFFNFKLKNLKMFTNLKKIFFILKLKNIKIFTNLENFFQKNDIFLRIFIIFF